jgi:hypothetical protein
MGLDPGSGVMDRQSELKRRQSLGLDQQLLLFQESKEAVIEFFVCRVAIKVALGDSVEYWKVQVGFLFGGSFARVLLETGSNCMYSRFQTYRSSIR